MQKDGPYVSFESVDFSVNFEISVEDGIHLGKSKCFFRQSYSFYFCVASGVWTFVKPRYLKGVYLFYSLPLAKKVTYRNVWMF